MVDMIEIALGIVAFTLIVNMMIFVILFARTRLVSTGDVTVEINGDPEKTITVPAGGKLLQTLAEQDLFLSSACGGGGTCAQCRCQVFDGGGSILATEEAHFNNREKKDFWRLSCQVPVKSDMKITVPDEVFGAKKWETTVKSNENVATFIKELILFSNPSISLIIFIYYLQFAGSSLHLRICFISSELKNFSSLA